LCRDSAFFFLLLTRFQPSPVSVLREILALSSYHPFSTVEKGGSSDIFLQLRSRELPYLDPPPPREQPAEGNSLIVSFGLSFLFIAGNSCQPHGGFEDLFRRSTVQITQPFPYCAERWRIFPNVETIGLQAGFYTLPP